MNTSILFPAGFAPLTGNDVLINLHGGVLLSADLFSHGDKMLSDIARLACERLGTDVWGIDPAGMTGFAGFTSRCAATTEAAEKLLADLQEVVTYRMRAQQEPDHDPANFHDVVLIVNHFPAGSNNRIVTMLGQIAGGMSRYRVHLVLRVRQAAGDEAANTCRRWLDTRMVLRVTDPEELDSVFDRRSHDLDPFEMSRPGMGAIAKSGERPVRFNTFQSLSHGGSQAPAGAPIAVGPFKVFPLLGGVKIKLGGEWQPGIYDGIAAACFAGGYMIANGADAVRQMWEQIRLQERTMTVADLTTLPRAETASPGVTVAGQ